MTNPKNKDIRDDEIRFVIRNRKTRDVRCCISSGAGQILDLNVTDNDKPSGCSSTDGKEPTSCSSTKDPKPSGCRWKFLLIVVVAAAAVVLAVILLWPSSEPAQDEDKTMAVMALVEGPEAVPAAGSDQQSAKRGKAYTELTDTVVDGRQLTILKPMNAKARLVIGDSILDVSGPVLATQAADVRGDNEQIAGAFVIDGQLKSRGKAKAGFCAIINDRITIGMAQTTQLLEKATEENGYFFRQFPLVYEGEIIENKLQNLSQRKALATLNGEVVVVLCHDRLTFHDFSQALADLGVKNAIYLVGSTAFLKARLRDGRTYLYGRRVTDIYPNTNYIVWE